MFPIIVPVNNRRQSPVHLSNILQLHLPFTSFRWATTDGGPWTAQLYLCCIQVLLGNLPFVVRNKKKSHSLWWSSLHLFHYFLCQIKVEWISQQEETNIRTWSPEHVSYLLLNTDESCLSITSMTAEKMYSINSPFFALIVHSVLQSSVDLRVIMHL